MPYEVYVTLAERLLAVAPFSGPAKAAFFNAGTEAVENAVKFARAYTKRPAIIAFEGAFHGRTLMSLTLTSKTHPYKAGLGPFAPEVYRVPFPNEYRGISATDALAAIERAFTTQVARDQVAAIILEPVQGEGGFIVPPVEFVHGVREICDREGIVMVVDEVQTGFGRTGRMFAIEHFGVEPDLMTVAKSIAAGLPLSGVLGKAEIMDAPGDGPSAARTSATRSPRRRRSPSSTSSRRRASSTVPSASETTVRGRMTGVAGALSADRRRPRPRRDARDRARPGPGDEGAGPGARVPDCRGGGPAGPPAPEGRRSTRTASACSARS